MPTPLRMFGLAAAALVVAGAAAAGETSMQDLERVHALTGRACYYSDFFDGRRTANGEVFRQSGYSAAHRTLPLGTWVEVESLATGRRLKLRVNDRGPYKGGFTIDLSRGAARFLGVDRAADRRVRIRVLALPGEPIPEEALPEEEEPATRVTLSGPSAEEALGAVIRSSRSACMKDTQ